MSQESHRLLIPQPAAQARARQPVLSLRISQTRRLVLVRLTTKESGTLLMAHNGAWRVVSYTKAISSHLHRDCCTREHQRTTVLPNVQISQSVQHSLTAAILAYCIVVSTAWKILRILRCQLCARRRTRTITTRFQALLRPI